MSHTRVKRLDTTQSTNADAMRLAQDGDRGPLWIVAREQMSGRGRRGRVWHSPPGNLYTSLLLTDPCTADKAPQLGFVAGVALIEAVESLTGQNQRLRLKWPNDLLCDQAKLTGILLEGTRLVDDTFVSVIGIGVNCISHPRDLPYAATNLSAVAGHEITPDELLPHLDAAMMRGLVRWDRGRDFAAVRDMWLMRAAGRDQPVEVALHDGVVRGRFETIDGAGRLVVATASGPLIVDAGDVRFTLAPPVAEPAMTA